MRFVYSFFVALCLGSATFSVAQTLQGEITSETGRELGRYTVELQPAAGASNAGETTYVAPDGRFEFRNITPGQYLVVVRDMNGFIVHRDFAGTQNGGRVEIRLPATQDARPASGTVSLHELQHKPPKAASRAYGDSLRKSEAGDRKAALELLEKAVALDPEYLQAVNNLGSQYLRAGRHEDAVRCFRRAIALSPRTPMLHANLAQALLFLKDFTGAERSARHAIALDATDPLTPRAQLALGVALANQGQTVSARGLFEECSRSRDGVVQELAKTYLSTLPK